MPAQPGRMAAMVAAVLAAVLAVTAAALWAWAGTPHSLQWAWGRLTQGQPLQAEGLDGSLRDGLRARTLRWEGTGATVEADGVEVRWSLAALAARQVQLPLVQAEAVRVTRAPRPGEVPRAPPALALPLAVHIERLAVGRLDWPVDDRRAGADANRRAKAGAADSVADSPGVLEAVEARYDYTPRGVGHRLELRSARWTHPRLGQVLLRGQATLGDQEPAVLQAKVSGDYLPARTAWPGLRFDASAAGLLADLPLRATLRPMPAANAPGPGGSVALALRLRPWEPRPWDAVDAQLDAVDLATLWPGAPRTALDGRARLSAPRTPGAPLPIAVHLRNRIAGPWDAGRLPLSRLEAEVERVGDRWRVPRVLAQAGEGRIEGSGLWRDARRWEWHASVQGLSGAQLHGRLADLPLAGELQMKAQGASVDFMLDLRAASAMAQAGARAATLAGASAALRAVRTRGVWTGDEVRLPELRLDLAPAVLEGDLVLRPAQRAGSGRLRLLAPGVRLQAEGAMAPDAGSGKAQLHVDALGRALETWRQVAAAWDASPAPANEGTQAPNPRLPSAVAGAAARATLAWSGGWRGPVQGRVLAAEAHQAWRLRLAAPQAWQWTSGGPLVLAAGAAVLEPPERIGSSQAMLRWDGLRWAPGALETRGRLTGLPMAWLGMASRTPLRGDLVFDGSWDVQLARELRLRATLARASGDLSVLAETADGLPARVAAGVRQASLTLEGRDGELSLALRWDSQRAGTVAGELATRLRPGGAAGWQWPREAPLAGQLEARLPRLAVWSLLAPAGWRLRGTLEADLEVAGTRAQPRWSGALRADGLGLRSVVDGIALQDGQLRARLEDRELRIESLRFSGASGAGRLQAEGVGRWPAGTGRWELQMQARLDRLPVSLLPERQVTVSGRARAQLAPAAAQLRADLRVDSARIVLPDQAAPRLGADVVVRGAPSPGGAAGTPPALDLQARIDLGEDFRIQGRGLSARARGAVDVSSSGVGTGEGSSPRANANAKANASAGAGGAGLDTLRLAGVVDLAGGTYLAFGQRLVLERGLLRFTGPAMDPSLDLLAVRRTPGNPQRVGVQVSGRARAPRIALWSEPALTQAETLSWLALGRPAAAGAGETAALEDLALSLLLRRAGLGAGPTSSAGGPTAGLAARLGLDELGLRREGGQGGASVTLGKRLAGNIYAVYERGLAGVLGTLRVFYDITRRLQLRLEAGDRSGVDLVYTVSID